MSLDRVDVRDFLEALGIKVESVSGENLTFLCPWHHERHPSARMNFKTTAWLCSVGCGQGNAITFLSKLRNMTVEEARNHIYARYGIGPGAPIDDLESEVLRNLARRVEVEPERVAPSEEWIEEFRFRWEAAWGHPAHEYMVEQRGFTVEELIYWEIGYDDFSHRVTIPVRDIHGTLVGFKGRAISPDSQPRYLILGTPLNSSGRFPFHTYAKSEHVFGLDRWRSQDSTLYIVEGELNVVALWRHGFPAVAVAGAEFSDRQRELIATHTDHVTIYFDDDGWRCTRERHYRGVDPGPCQVCGAETYNPGQRGTSKVASAMMSFVGVDVILNAPGDAAELGAHVVRELATHVVPALELGIQGKLTLAPTT